MSVGIGKGWTSCEVISAGGTDSVGYAAVLVDLCRCEGDVAAAIGRGSLEICDGGHVEHVWAVVDDAAFSFGGSMSCEVTASGIVGPIVGSVSKCSVDNG